MRTPLPPPPDGLEVTLEDFRLQLVVRPVLDELTQVGVEEEPGLGALVIVVSTVCVAGLGVFKPQLALALAGLGGIGWIAYLGGTSADTVLSDPSPTLRFIVADGRIRIIRGAQERTIDLASVVQATATPTGLCLDLGGFERMESVPGLNAAEREWLALAVTRFSDRYGRPETVPKGLKALRRESRRSGPE